jgi:hypothetical protein
VKCDAVAAVTRRSFEFDEASEKIMDEAIIDEVVWSSVIGASLHQKQRLPESSDKKPAIKSEQMFKNNYQVLLSIVTVLLVVLF